MLGGKLLFPWREMWKNVKKMSSLLALHRREKGKVKKTHITGTVLFSFKI